MNDNNHKDRDTNEAASPGEDLVPTLETPIPELTQQIPVVDQVIPELTQKAIEPGLVAVKDEIPELTEIADTSEESEQQQEELDINYTITSSQVSDHELEIQQWQIEQQARAQMGDWQALGAIESVTAKQTDHEQVNREQEDTDSTTHVEVEMDSEHQAILDASWQRLESLIMENLPPEIAGIYLTTLEQHLTTNKQLLAEDMSLLEQDTVDNLLDYFQIDLGF